MLLKGVYAPLVTPFDDNENIDYPVLEKLIEFLLENGIEGFVPGGTTGEVYALRDDERLEVFRFVKNVVNGRAHLMAGTNSGATRDVIRLSREAEKIGYDSLMLAVPPYSRPNQRELLSHYKDVIHSTNLPVILYNFPWRAGTEVGFDVLDGLVNFQQVLGLKEASSDLSRILAMRTRYEDRYQIVCGSDDQAFDYLAWGSQCWIGGAASCTPKQHVQVVDAALKKDLIKSRDMMSVFLPILQNMESGSYTQKVKLGCELQGIPVGRTRKPLLPLEEQEKQEFSKLFNNIILA